MTTVNSKAQTVLRNLLATCKDGESGYRSAADDIEAGPLKEFFTARQEQRELFAAELLDEIRRLDTAREQKGSVAALIHRGWMNMKAALARRSVPAVVDECVRGEDAALKDYAQALRQGLPPEVEALVEKQYEQVKEAHQRVTALKAIAVLHELIATCKDGAHGYRSAVDRVSEQDLKKWFAECMDERKRFADALQVEAHRLGDPYEDSGTLAAAVHRGWMGVKAAVKGPKAGAVLAECARGEGTALEHYEAALLKELPAEVRSLVELQYEKIKEAHERLCELQGETCQT